MSRPPGSNGVRALARLVVLPLLGVVAGLVAAYLVTATVTPTYRATASVVVLPKQTTASGSDLTDVSLALNVSPSVARLAESREVAGVVAQRLRLPEDQVLGKATAVSEPGNQIVTVQAEAGTPESAAGIANGVTRATTELYNQLRLSGKSGVSVQALDAAAPPIDPVSPRPLLNDALGALVGLLIGLGVITLRTRADDRFRGVRELEKRLGLPTFGRLRSVPHRPRSAAELYRRRRLHGSVDAMIASLTVLAGERSRVRIMITSAGDDRLTAVVAALLTHGLARQGRRALVVDGQRRRHGVDRFVAARFATSVPEVLDPATGFTGARMITVGALADHLDGSLTAERVAGLLDGLADRTDVLVVTAPPVFSGTGTATLAHHVDVVLMIVDTDEVGVPAATRAALLVRRLDVALVGTVVTGTAVERDGAHPGVWLARSDASPTRSRSARPVAAGVIEPDPESAAPEPVVESARERLEPVVESAPEPVVESAREQPVPVVTQPAPVHQRPVLVQSTTPPPVVPATSTVTPTPTPALIGQGDDAPGGDRASTRWRPFAKVAGRHAGGSGPLGRADVVGHPVNGHPPDLDAEDDDTHLNLVTALRGRHCQGPTDPADDDGSDRDDGSDKDDGSDDLVAARPRRVRAGGS